MLQQPQHIISLMVPASAAVCDVQRCHSSRGAVAVSSSTSSSIMYPADSIIPRPAQPEALHAAAATVNMDARDPVVVRNLPQEDIHSTQPKVLIRTRSFHDQDSAHPKLVYITEAEEDMYQRDCADRNRHGIKMLTRGQWLNNEKRAQLKQPHSERRRKKTEAQRRRRLVQREGKFSASSGNVLALDEAGGWRNIVACRLVAVEWR